MKYRPLRIGIVAMGLESSRDFRSAGVARYAYSLLEAIANDRNSKHEFHFFLLPSFEVPQSWSSAKHVKIHRTWKRYNKWTLIAGGLVAKGLGLDFLFTTANAVPFWSPVPTGVFIHDLFPLDHPEWFPEATAAVNKKTIPAAVKRSRLVLVNSEATKRDVLRHFSIQENRVVVTPLAGGNKIERLPVGDVDRVRLRSIGVEFDRYILTLSTIEPRKNLGNLIEAFKEIVENPKFGNVGLVVAGSKGWKFDEALAKIDSFGLTDRVKLTGYIDDKDLPHLFGGCEFYVCASISEGFGMPLVEAMEAGAPVLSSSGGALPEVGGEAVRYFDPSIVSSIADALSEALRHGADREEWATKGAKQARLFNWEKAASATISAIEKAI